MRSESLVRRMCPACERANRGQGDRCLYCGAPLAPVLQEMVPAAHDEPPPPPPPSEHTGAVLACPRCKEVAMVEGEVIGITVHRCPECRGIFLDPNTLHWMVQRQIQQARFGEDASDGAVRMSVERGEAELRVEYIHCPVCGRQMARRNYANASGVILDVCSDHGVWLDDHELAHLLNFVATGGHRLADLLDQEDAEQRRLREYRASLDYFGPYEGMCPD